jgi:hypothetical protein
MVNYFDMTCVGTEWLQSFRVVYLIEMIRNSSVFPGVLFGSVIVMLCLYLIITVWTTGGIIGSLRAAIQPEPQNGCSRNFLGRFSCSGGRLFGRYFRLTILSGSLMIISLIPVIFGIIGIIVSLLLIIIWIMISDVTKILMCLDDSTNLFKNYIRSLLWTIRHFAFMGGLYFSTFLALILGYGIYTLLDQSFTANTAFMIFIMFMNQQIWIWWRSLVRVQLFGAVMITGIEWDEQSAVPTAAVNQSMSDITAADAN